MEALVVGLAAWRLASLISRERGPYAAFERFRAWVMPEGDVSSGFPRFRDEVTQAIECMWCLALWCAIPMWLLYNHVMAVPVILAAAAVAMIAQEVTDGTR